jgi:hypothetical protein
MGSEAGADGNSERSWRTWCKSRWTQTKPSLIPPAPKTETRNTWTMARKLRSAFARKEQPQRPNLQVYVQTRNTNWTRFFRRPNTVAGPVAESGAAAMEDMDDLDDVQGEQNVATPSEASIGSHIAPLDRTALEGTHIRQNRANETERINLNMREASAQLRASANPETIATSATQVSLEQPRQGQRTPVRQRERREGSTTPALNLEIPAELPGDLHYDGNDGLAVPLQFNRLTPRNDGGLEYREALRQTNWYEQQGNAGTIREMRLQPDLQQRLQARRERPLNQWEASLVEENGNALTANDEEEEIRWLIAHERYQAAILDLDLARPSRRRELPPQLDTRRLPRIPVASQTSRGAATPNRGASQPQSGTGDNRRSATPRQTHETRNPQHRERARSLGNDQDLPVPVTNFRGSNFNTRAEMELLRRDNEEVLQQNAVMQAQNAEVLRRLEEMAHAPAIPPPPVKIYKRGYVAGTASDKESVHSFEKQVFNDAGRVVLNPNIITDAIINGMSHTRSGIRYINAMAKRCTMIPDQRAAGVLATGVHGTIRDIVQMHYESYMPTLPNGTLNPQDHWSYVCEHIESSYTINDTIKELRDQIMALAPERESTVNNALQAYKSKFHSLKAQIRSLTGSSEEDPYKTAKSERDHVLKVIQPEIRHMYETMHNMNPDTSDNTTLFWVELLKNRRIYVETLHERRISFQRMEAVSYTHLTLPTKP